MSLIDFEEETSLLLNKPHGGTVVNRLITPSDAKDINCHKIIEGWNSIIKIINEGKLMSVFIYKCNTKIFNCYLKEIYIWF